MNTYFFAAYPTEVNGGSLSLADIISPSGVDLEIVPSWLYRDISDTHRRYVAGILAPYGATLTCSVQDGLAWRCESLSGAKALQADIASGVIPAAVRAFNVHDVESLADWLALAS